MYKSRAFQREIYTQKEVAQIVVSHLVGKVEGVAQQMMASALNTEVQVTKSASEGGAWGIALLAAYMVNKSDFTIEEVN